jgi:hypothetical protein
MWAARRLAGAPVLVLSVALCLLAFPATAQEEDNARQAYTEALELVDQERFEEALGKFREAYELVPHYAVLFNIGHACVILGRPAEAIDAFTRYLDEGEEQVELERQEEVRQLIEQERGKVFELVVSIEPAGAIFQLDGQHYGLAPLTAPLLLAPGRHELRVEHDEYQPTTRQVDAFAGGRESLEIVLEPARTREVEQPHTAAIPPAPAAPPIPSAPSWDGATEAESPDTRPSKTTWRVARATSGAVAILGGGLVIQSSLKSPVRSPDPRGLH